MIEKWTKCLGEGGAFTSPLTDFQRLRLFMHC